MKKLSLTYRSLIFFSIPSILTSLVEVFASGIDTALVGHLSTKALAALAVASTVFNSLTWVFNFLVNASLEAVAHYRGRGDVQLISKQMRMSLILSLGIGFFATGLLYFGRSFWYQLAGAQDSFLVELDLYFSIRSWGQWVSIFFLTLISLFRGMGHVRAAFIMMATTTGLNALLSYILIYHFNMGIAGAAWGTISSTAVTTIISLLWFLSHYRHLLIAPFKDLWGGEWLRMGLNSRDLFLRSLFLTFSFFLSTRIASMVGVTSLAAHQILLQAWLFCAYVVDGIALSGTIIGAESFGRDDKTESRMMSERLLHLAGVVGLLFTLFYLLFRSQFVALFTSDEKVLDLVLKLWFLIIVSQVINAAAFVYDGLLFGFNRFSYLRKHMILGVLICFLPLSLYSYIQKDIVYMWWGMVLLNFYRALTGFQEIKRLL